MPRDNVTQYCLAPYYTGHLKWITVPVCRRQSGHSNSYHQNEGCLRWEAPPNVPPPQAVAFVNAHATLGWAEGTTQVRLVRAGTVELPLGLYQALTHKPGLTRQVRDRFNEPITINLTHFLDAAKAVSATELLRRLVVRTRSDLPPLGVNVAVG